MSPNTNTHRHNLNKIEHQDEELISSSSPLRSNGIIRMEQQGEKEGKNNIAGFIFCIDSFGVCVPIRITLNHFCLDSLAN